MKLTAHDVQELSEAIREIAAWNAATVATTPKMVLSTSGPFTKVGSTWWACIRSVVTDTDPYQPPFIGEADTLGDAVDAAMKAWKEARG